VCGRNAGRPFASLEGMSPEKPRHPEVVPFVPPQPDITPERPPEIHPQKANPEIYPSQPSREIEPEIVPEISPLEVPDEPLETPFDNLPFHSL